MLRRAWVTGWANLRKLTLAQNMMALQRTAAVLLLLSCFHEHKVSQSTAVIENVAAWYACNHRRADGYGAG